MKRKNSQILNAGSVWFGDNGLADGRSWHRPNPEGAINVQNGQAIQTRLFED